LCVDLSVHHSTVNEIPSAYSFPMNQHGLFAEHSVCRAALGSMMQPTPP
jgi:hypothetical protein